MQAVPVPGSTLLARGREIDSRGADVDPGPAS